MTFYEVYAGITDLMLRSLSVVSELYGSLTRKGFVDRESAAGLVLDNGFEGLILALDGLMGGPGYEGSDDMRFRKPGENERINKGMRVND